MNFVRTILPLIADGQQEGADKTKEEVASLDVPLVRQQLRAAEMLDAIRIHRQGITYCHICITMSRNLLMLFQPILIYI